jgi:hypothetical protein
MPIRIRLTVIMQHIPLLIAAFSGTFQSSREMVKELNGNGTKKTQTILIFDRQAKGR